MKIFKNLNQDSGKKKTQMELFKNAEKGQFVLKDILYSVTYTSLSAVYQDMELILYPEVEAETKDAHVEYEMRSVDLYHNNGFNTHTSNFQQLKGKKFIWEEEYNAAGEEAGFFCVQEHEAVTEGIIEILDVEAGQMTIKWSGRADVRWNKKYGTDVPFETIFTVDIPDTVNYMLDAFASTKMHIDSDTWLEVLNLEEFNQEIMRVCETRIWESFNTILKFKLNYKDTEYFGEVVFTNGKNNYELHIDADCPRKVQFEGVDYNLKVRYEVFTFSIS